MPSLDHEALLLLFRKRPTLAAELLAGALAVPLPDYASVAVEDAALGDVAPTEYRADLVLSLQRDARVLAVVVEVQLRPDDGKRWSWPVYLTTLRARLRCPCVLLVVTTDEATARWASSPIELGQPGAVLRPLVLGPAAVPVVTDLAEAIRAPELAVLSAMAHGKSTDGAVVARAAIASAAALDDEAARLYADLVFQHLGPMARAALEKLMLIPGYEYQSDFARKYIGIGKAEGRAEGRAQGKAEAVLTLLAARDVSVSAEQRERILACRDVGLLDAWLVAAASAHHAKDVVED